ncbi:MAG: sigma-54 dependent transcriptional regulator [Bacteroidota bacterium]
MKQQSEATCIFIVEDDPMYQHMIKYFAEMDPNHVVHTFTTGKSCIEHLHLNPHIISLDYTLPDIKGIEVLNAVKKYNEKIEVIVLSGQQDIGTAVELIREGAYDYITKDKSTKDRFFTTINNIKKKMEMEQTIDDLKDQLAGRHELETTLIGNSPPIQQILGLIRKAVRNNITVSISGETGTGKEVVAKTIHYNSARKRKPFVAVNMSAIPKELVESELFGYEKGAFTGAQNRKKGRVELSNGGTLFLDEIGEMDLNMQAKILRVLQEREFVRVGGEKPVKFDSRIIIATHRDLKEEVNKGRFREDLYYRLLGLNVHLPPLRQRGSDIILLAKYFLKMFCKENKMPAFRLSEEAVEKMMKYQYPGNVRELKAVIELAAVISEGQVIGEDNVHFNSPRREYNFITEEMTLETYKRRIIFHYLEKYGQDINLVAKKLDIGVSTIYRILKEEKSKSSVEGVGFLND